MTDSAAVPADDARLAGQQKKGHATRKRDDAQDSHKLSLWGRLVRFVREIIAEMKKVRYPTNEELWQYFMVVIGFVAVLMAFTGIIDLVFDKLNLLVFV